MSAPALQTPLSQELRVREEATTTPAVERDGCETRPKSVGTLIRLGCRVRILSEQLLTSKGLCLP